MDTSNESMASSDENPSLKQLLERLTGEDIPFTSKVCGVALQILTNQPCSIGYSQFNELLLSLGYDRVTQAFFQYLVDGKTDFRLGAAICSLKDLAIGIERFRTMAVLLYGNVRYAFKQLSKDTRELEDWLANLKPVDLSNFQQRHKPVHPIQDIPGEDTYYLGYIVQQQISDRLRECPNDQRAMEQKAKQAQVVQIGEHNYEAYLASDHLDVYVATSMRERHEYYLVNKWIKSIFNHEILAPLQLRWFDPTQAYCSSRIDKGLFETLMIKRAKCTIYFAQEVDTLGKDSELASTLAQGKPVVAFIPSVKEGDAENLLSELLHLYPEEDERGVILEQLRIFSPEAAWKDAEVREWLNNPSSFDKQRAVAKLQKNMEKRYDGRASILSETHPLGIQVYLANGVANGILVVRNIDDCAKLVYRIVTQTMEFSLEEVIDKDRKYVHLEEKISGCVYRVVTGDAMLTNTFWNFYLTSF